MITPQELVDAARSAMKNSYSPYSHFTVGAAAVCGGKIYRGANIENASYGATVCAERNAVFTAVFDCCTFDENGQILRADKPITALAVAGGLNGIVSGPAFPCGICRQVIAEFCPPDAMVYIATADGYISRKVSKLLPDVFSI